MKEEVVSLIQDVLKTYPARRKPEVVIGDFDRISEISSEIIEIFEKNKTTYEEAYAILSFTYEALKYKSNNVHL